MTQIVTKPLWLCNTRCGLAAAARARSPNQRRVGCGAAARSAAEAARNASGGRRLAAPAPSLTADAYCLTVSRRSSTSHRPWASFTYTRTQYVPGFV